MRRLCCCVLLLLLCISARSVVAWRARVHEAYGDIPVLRRWEAETLTEAARHRIADDLALGGAVRLENGGATLTMEAELDIGYYSLWPYARSDHQRPVYLEMIVTSPSGAAERSRQRVPHRRLYLPVTHLHLRVHEAGTWRIELRACEGTEGPLLVDQIELRDEMPGCVRRPLKKRGDLIESDLGGRIRPKAAEQLQQDLEAQTDLAAFYRNLRASMPPMNALLGDCDKLYTEELKALHVKLAQPGFRPTPWYEPWMFVDEKAQKQYGLTAYLSGEPYLQSLPDRGGGYFVPAGQHGIPRATEGAAPQVDSHHAIGPASARGRHLTIATLAPAFQSRLAQIASALEISTVRYLKSRNKADARRTAVLLAVLADRAASLDPRVQSMIHNFGYWSFTRFGRHTGSGLDYRQLAAAYDAIFEAMKDDRELAKIIHAGIPWVRTPADLTAFFDYAILQQGLVRHFRFMRQGMQTGWERGTLPLILALGTNEVSQSWMDRFMRRGFADLTANAGWQDHLICGYHRDGSNSVGGTEYTKASASGVVVIADMLETAAERGLRVPRSTWDPKTNPRLLEAGEWLLGFRTAGGFSSYFGEWGDCISHRRYPTYPYGNFRSVYLKLFDWTGDVRYARMVAAYGRGDLPEKTWQEISARAEGARMPILAQRSLVMPGFGSTVLELNPDTEDYRQKASVLLRHGSGRGHAHGDLLDMSINAYGYRVCPDGGRAFWPFPRFTAQHNTVEVDRSSFQSGGINSGAYGYNLLFKPLPGAQFASAGGWCSTHPQLRDYRRDIAIIACGEADFYVFSVVRVDGGKVHTYCFHGSRSEEWGTNCGEKPTEKDPLNLMDRCKDWRSGRTKDPTVFSWKLALPKNDPADVHVRHHAFGIGGLTFYMARGTGSYNIDAPFFWAERIGNTSLSDAYLSVTEPWKGARTLRSVRDLQLNRAEVRRGHERVRAVEVVTARGRRDILAANGRPGKVVELDGGLRFDGRFAFVAEDRSGLVRATLIGGTTLKKGPFSIEAGRAEYSGKILDVHKAYLRLTTDVELPQEVLDGQHFQFGHLPHRSSAHVSAAEGRTLKLLKKPTIYRSPIRRVDTEERAVYPEIQMPWTAAEPRYYDGATATNEAHDRFWKVRVEPVELWFPLLSPIAAEDITDADGDGRITVRLNGFAAPQEVRDPVVRYYGPFTKPVRWRQMNREPFAEPVELTVTRVDADRRRLYFQPPTTDYDLLWHRWIYSGCIISNESGSRQWLASYPATEFRIRLNGGEPPRAAHFTDVDGDGRACLEIYDFGPGDPWRLDTHVHVERTDRGDYSVRSDVPCTVRVPDGKVLRR